MKYPVKILILILVFISCNSQKRIVEKDTDTSLNKSQYDKIPNSEIEDIIKIAIDLPELQYYF